MKKYSSRIITMVLLTIAAAIIVIPNYHLSLLVTAGISLVLLGGILFAGRNKPLSSQLFWVAAVAVLIFFVLPFGYISVKDILSAIAVVAEALGQIFGYTAGIVSLVALVALRIILRKKPNPILTAAGYAAALMLLMTVRYIMFPDSEIYSKLIIAVVAMCLARELSGYNEGIAAPSMLRCVLMVLFFLLIGNFGGLPIVAKRIEVLFQTGNANWFVIVLGVFLAGVLVLLDDYFRSNGSAKHIFKTNNTGWVMLIWCLMAIVMNIWHMFNNTATLFIGVPLASAMANDMMDSVEDPDWSWGCQFAAAWGFLAAMLMLLAKSINVGSLMQYILIAMLLAAWLFWGKMVNSPMKWDILAQTMGVLAILMLESMHLTDVWQLQEAPMHLLGVVLSCAIWCVVCCHTIRLNKMASDLYENEFANVKWLQLILAALLLLIAVGKALFAL